VARRLALILAGDRYDDSAFSSLRAHARDVDALTRVLADPSIGGFEVRSLMNRPAHEIAFEIEEFFSDRDPENLLLLYLSCHGVRGAADRLYFATTTTRLHRLAATAVSSVFITEQMERSRAKRVVLMLDCCYSGALAGDTGAHVGSTLEVAERFQGVARHFG